MASSHARLVHHHGLETALQRLVFLDVLLVLLQRGGANGVQLAARQGRLEQVGRVHGAFAAAAGANERVHLVDEEHDLAFGVGHFLDHGLQALLKLALVLGACHQQAHVEAHDGFVFQVFGHVAAHDALRQALHDGGFAHAGLAEQHGVVLGAAAQDLQHAADLLVAADHRVYLAGAGQLVQVFGVALQALVLGPRRSGRSPCVPPRSSLMAAFRSFSLKPASLSRLATLSRPPGGRAAGARWPRTRRPCP